MSTKHWIYDALDQVDDLGVGFFEDESKELTAAQLVDALFLWEQKNSVPLELVKIAIRCEKDGCGIGVYYEGQDPPTAEDDLAALKRKAFGLGYSLEPIKPEQVVNVRSKDPPPVRRSVRAKFPDKFSSVREKLSPPLTEPGKELDQECQFCGKPCSSLVKYDGRPAHGQCIDKSSR